MVWCCFVDRDGLSEACAASKPHGSCLCTTEVQSMGRVYAVQRFSRWTDGSYFLGIGGGALNLAVY